MKEDNYLIHQILKEKNNFPKRYKLCTILLVTQNINADIKSKNIV